MPGSCKMANEQFIILFTMVHDQGLWLVKLAYPKWRRTLISYNVLVLFMEYRNYQPKFNEMFLDAEDYQ